MEKICVVYAVLLGNHLLKTRKVIPYGLLVQEKPANARVLQSVDCDWWVYNRCLNIYYQSSDAGEKTWAKKHFCQKHMPDVKKVGWDKELQQDVVLPSNSKKSLKKSYSKKINNWNFCSDLWNLLIPFVSWNVDITLPYLFLLWFNNPLFYPITIFLVKMFNICSNYSCYNSIIIYIFSIKI